jgi:rubrerythrin
MNLQNILTEIEKVDPEVYDRLDSRRGAMQRFAFAGKVLAAAAVPSAIGSMFKKAYGQNSNKIIEVLNYALTLEYLEYEFYKKGVEQAPIPNATARGALTTIRNHEQAHVNLLRDTIISLGGTPVMFTSSSFDFTAKETFPTVFSDYGVFLAVAQTFEDTGVRAYKGQAANLLSNDLLLRTALRIHSVEARHASHLREMRSRYGGALIPSGIEVQPWITLDQSGIASAAVQPTYNGEALTSQAGVNIININGFEITAEDASEAFDEPLTMEQVLAIASPFLA